MVGPADPYDPIGGMTKDEGLRLSAELEEMEDEDVGSEVGERLAEAVKEGLRQRGV